MWSEIGRWPTVILNSASDTSIKHFWKYANIKPIDSVAIDYNRRASNPIDKRANNSMNMVTKY